MTVEVTDRLATLADLSHAELKAQWEELFGETAPQNLSKRLMIYALAYRIQVQAYGGLSNAIRQDLRARAGRTVSKQRISTQSGVGADEGVNRPGSGRLAGQRPPPALKLYPGTRLMREWRGNVHVVDVTDEGFVWNGRCFRSLSAIARTITGVRWNGLAFFGLRKRRNGARSNPVRQKDSASGSLPRTAIPSPERLTR